MTRTRRVVAVLLLVLFCLVSADVALASPVSSPYNTWYLANATASSGSPAALDSSTTSSLVVINASVPAVPSVASPYQWLVFVAYCNGTRVDAQSSYYWGGNGGHAAGTFSLSYPVSLFSGCSAGSTVSIHYGIQVNATSPSGAGTVIGTEWGSYDFRNGAAPPGAIPGCTALSDVRVSYDGTKWYVRYKAGTVGSLDHWRFDVPDPHQYLPGSPITTLKAGTDDVEGSPGYLYKSVTGSSGSSWAITAVDSSGAGLCQLGGTAVYSGTVTPGGGTYGATNPDDGSSDCGWNPFCYIKAALKWAFVPPDGSMDGMGDSWDELSGKVPFSVITATATLVGGLGVGHSGCYTHGPHYCWPEGWTIGGQVIFPYDSPASDWLRSNRTLLGTILWISVLLPLSMVVFWRVIPVVGGGGRGSD